MPRNATSDFITSLAQPNIFPALLVSVTLANGVVNLSTGYRPITDQNGITYSGVGSLLSVSTVEDGSDVTARGASVTLSGIDPLLLQGVLNEFLIGQPATISLVSLNADGSIIGAVVAFSGRTDQPEIVSSESTASITINLESILLDMNTPISLRYTNIDQQRDYPGDRGFSLVNSIQQIPIYWGQNTNSDGNA